MFKRPVIMLALALGAGVVATFPLLAGASSQNPAAAVPPGWTQQTGKSSGSEYFLPPGATNMSIYEAIFPTQVLDGTLEDTAKVIWRAVVGSERVVDTKGNRITVSDGAPAYEVLVASIDAQNRGVYRIFVVKQYGQHIAAGELRFDDVDRIQAIGKPAIASLENMSVDYGGITPAQAGEVTPYHARLLTPSPHGGIDQPVRPGGFPGGLSGMWVLKVPGVAYTTSANYGAYTENTLHVSAGAAAGYLHVGANRHYVWYGSDGKAESSGRLLQIVPRRDVRPGHTYWRVFEGREEH